MKKVLKLVNYSNEFHAMQYMFLLGFFYSGNGKGANGESEMKRGHGKSERLENVASGRGRWRDFWTNWRFLFRKRKRVIGRAVRKKKKERKSYDRSCLFASPFSQLAKWTYSHFKIISFTPLYGCFYLKLGWWPYVEGVPLLFLI